MYNTSVLAEPDSSVRAYKPPGRHGMQYPLSALILRISWGGAEIQNVKCLQWAIFFPCRYYRHSYNRLRCRRG
jgi:hypothetical protein